MKFSWIISGSSDFFKSENGIEKLSKKISDTLKRFLDFNPKKIKKTVIFHDLKILFDHLIDRSKSFKNHYFSAIIYILTRIKCKKTVIHHKIYVVFAIYQYISGCSKHFENL